MTHNNDEDKIIPSLWFGATNGDISKILDYYKAIFQDNFEPGGVNVLDDTPSGKTELCEVQLFGRKYSLMSTAQKHDDFNDAMALTIICEDQSEIDRYWEYFTREGKEVQCGWCIDKYGLRWQVLPKDFDKLMSRPNSWQVMMGQKKIIIAEYL